MGFSLFSLLILIYFLNIIFCDEALVVINDSKIKILTANIMFLKESIANQEMSELEYFSLSGKLCDQRTNETILNNCLIKYEPYNSQWILLIDTSSVLKIFYDLKVNYTILTNGRIVSLVVNNDTVPQDEIRTDYLTPLFLVNTDLYKKLSKYVVNNEEDNIIVDLLYSRFNSLFLDQITFYLSISFFGILSITLILWQVILCLYQERDNHQETSIQKVFQSFLYLKTGFAILIVYYFKIGLRQMDNHNMNENVMKIYLESIIVTVNTILITVLWFIILMISYGWQIFRGFFSRNELRKFIISFIILYVIVCLDQILDLLIKTKIYTFKPSDLKNIILYLSLTTLCVYLCIKTRRVLRVRYTYAYHFSREYMPSIKLKMQMMTWHIIAVIFYCTLFLVILIVKKTILAELITDQLTMMLFYYVDLLALIIMLLIYRPRRFPQYFDVYSDNLNNSNELLNDVNNFFNIWFFKLKLRNNPAVLSTIESSYSIKLYDEGISKKEETEFHKIPHAPIIVINPVFEENEQSPDIGKFVIGIRK